MNVNLKKIKILEPKVKINTELKTITRESSGRDILPYYTLALNITAGNYILGKAEQMEE